jgi:hypothetical protein
MSIHLNGQSKIDPIAICETFWRKTHDTNNPHMINLVAVEPGEPYFIMWEPPDTDNLEYILMMLFTPKTGNEIHDEYESLTLTPMDVKWSN